MDDFALGVRAFQKGRYEEAHQKLLPFAENGSVRAQTILARLYYAGNGVAKDLKKYEYWLKQAADKGDKSAKARVKHFQDIS